MDLPLMRLLQLASPALPVGAYTYSQGLEWAIAQEAVYDEATAKGWIDDLLRANIARFEAPWLAQLMDAWDTGDEAALAQRHALYLASRETAELRAETLQMGHSLRRLLGELPGFPETYRERLLRPGLASYPLAWSCAASAWKITPDAALCAYMWSWAENLIMAAIKSVPLGQSAGQRILHELAVRMPVLAADALVRPLEQTSNFAPGFAIACSRHETQYTRLFRS
jgi:urease accessory protein